MSEKSKSPRPSKPSYQIPLPAEQSKVLAVLVREKTAGYSRNEGISGPDLGAALEEHRESKNYAAFYYLMARLEKAGLVKSESVVVEHGPYKTRQKYFQVTEKGVTAFRESMEFWKQVSVSSGCKLVWI